MTETLNSIKAHGLETSITKHLGDLENDNHEEKRLHLAHAYLGILLPILLKDQFSLDSLVLVLSPPPILSSLSLVLGHC